MKDTRGDRQRWKCAALHSIMLMSKIIMPPSGSEDIGVCVCFCLCLGVLEEAVCVLDFTFYLEMSPLFIQTAYYTES